MPPERAEKGKKTWKPAVRVSIQVITYLVFSRVR
jgi:hypothetical protein